jgi:hypothetical protein
MKRVCRAHCWVLRQHARACAVLGSQGSLVVIPLPVVGVGVRNVGGFSWLVFENCTVDASIFVVQVIKGIRWMPGHQEPMKDVGGCDKPRGAANQAEIRGCPNGETRPQSCGVTRT